MPAVGTGELDGEGRAVAHACTLSKDGALVHFDQHPADGKAQSSFFKRHQDTGFIELEGAANEEFGAKERFSATCAAANQRGPPGGDSAACNLVKS